MSREKMHRREFIKALAIAGSASTLSGMAGPLLAQSSYTGKLLLTLQLQGGLDVTSFCDPKTNVSGEPEINRWARTADILQAGNLSYAPFAENSSFFDKYYKDILVINGVDAQTNSHSVGEVHNWSGRNAEGFPTITSLMAAINAPDLPLSYLNFGGFGNTQSIIRSTRIDDVGQIKNIIFPNSNQWDEQRNYRTESDWQRIQALHVQNMEQKNQAANVSQGNKKNRQYYTDAITRAEGIQAFGDLIPNQDSIQQGRSVSNNIYSTLHQQIQISLLAFKSGVSISADLLESGFDSHNDHEGIHRGLLTNFTDAIDYLWTSAEELGLADRIVLVVGSDFGRTPFFNAGDGKDHWPIGSYMVMEKNVAYTNQMIGETDGGHNAFKINSDTLVRDDSKGALIHPKHIHKALRRYMGLESSAITKLFPFNNTENFGFFG